MQSSSIKDELLLIHKTKGSITIQKRPAPYGAGFFMINQVILLAEDEEAAV